MSEEESQGVVVIVGRRAFEVRVYKRSFDSYLLTVVADRHSQWTFVVAGWRDWSCGASEDEFYIWTARKFISFPNTAGNLVDLDVDDDILAVFKLGLEWLIVCETSIRLLQGRRELARVEWDDVIEAVEWENDSLIVLDQSGSHFAVMVQAEKLILVAMK